MQHVHLRLHSGHVGSTRGLVSIGSWNKAVLQFNSTSWWDLQLTGKKYDSNRHVRKALKDNKLPVISAVIFAKSLVTFDICECTAMEIHFSRAVQKWDKRLLLVLLSLALRETQSRKGKELSKSLIIWMQTLLTHPCKAVWNREHRLSFKPQRSFTKNGNCGFSSAAKCKNISLISYNYCFLI